MLKNQVWK